MIPSLQGMERTEYGNFRVTQKNVEYEKISGTRMAGLLGLSRWDTPFTTTAKLLGIYNEDISDKKEVQAGSALEGKILSYIGAIPAEVMFDKREGDHRDWPSDFDDEIFCGHLDGSMPDGAVVEVKTTKNPEDWQNGPPTYYWVQASLYAHFMGTDRIVFAVGFTDDATLNDPSVWEPNEKNVARFDVPIIDGFDGMLEKARDIYRRTVLEGQTTIPDMGNPLDAKVYELLSCQMWSDSEVSTAVDVITGIQAKMDEYKGLEKELTDAKECMGLYMATHDLDIVQNKSYVVKKATMTKNIVDTDALKRDGLYDIYQKKTTYDILRISRRK